MYSPGNSDDLNYRREIEKTLREINQFVLSDSLWKMWRSITDSQLVVPQKDSTIALKRLASGSNRVKKAVELLEQSMTDSVDQMLENKIKLQSILELEKARVDLEESIRLNPFDLRTQKWLIWVFQRLAELHAERGDFSRSTTMLEYLAYILKDDPQLYFKLGEYYLWQKKWAKARANLQKSINIILDSDWETINTDELYAHYSMRAEAEIRLGLVQEALLTLNYAKLIAPTPEEAGKVQWKTDWINWDDGNLENSREYDRLKEKYARCKEYDDLKADYLELYEKLHTFKAKSEIQWQVATLEFQYLGEKNTAIDRLYKIIRDVKLDSSGMAEVLDYQKYLNDYGKMCYNLGVEYLESNNFKLAFIYFAQSVTFYWDEIGKSYLQLAALSSIHNDVAIEYCNKALQFRHSLSSVEVKKTYELLFKSYKRKGEFKKAEPWYRKLVNSQL
ncbi:hypothetical protein GF337_01670 [candidate division KSB1 bacterium]|nr:hypothetical protein [candidate division KSB1 bacterium]